MGTGGGAARHDGPVYNFLGGVTVLLGEAPAAAGGRRDAVVRSCDARAVAAASSSASVEEAPIEIPVVA